MKCSACGSEHTQKLSALCASGSELAHKMAAPEKAKPAWAGFWIFAAGFGLLILMLAFFTRNDTHGAISSTLGWVFFIPSVVFIVRSVMKANKYNETTWKENYKIWLETWYCHRCGTLYD